MTPTRLTRQLATLSPVVVPAPDGLDAALDSRDVDLDGATVATAVVLVATLASVLLAVAVVGVGGRSVSRGLLALLVGPLLAVAGLTEVSRVLALRRRAAWAGGLPGFVCRVTLGMRLTPTLEAGMAAGLATTGPLAERAGRRPGVDAAANLDDALADLGSDAQRVGGLLRAATTATDPDVLLDRAVETAMAGTTDRLRTYAADLQGPVTAIYAFGVVLPLALVGILPAAPLAGFDLPLAGLAVVLDVALPSCLLGATASLVARRPVLDQPPRLSFDHPALGDARAVALSAAVAGSLAVLVGAFLPDWAPVLLAPAWMAGAAAFARYHPALATVDDRSETRAALPDLLALLGDAMADGVPPEHALARAGDVPGTAGRVAATATDVQRRLGIPVQAALAGDHGPLAALHDHHSTSVAALVAAAGDAGRPGGRALSGYADHLDALAALDRTLRADLAGITGTLDQTAALYAPAIGGVTVALATRLRDASGALATTGDGFPLVVGGYVLILAVVLPALARTLADGWCRVRVGASVGRALLSAGVIFPTVAAFAGRLL